MKNISIVLSFVLFVIFGLSGQVEHKNNLALEIGFGGGDGAFPTRLYGVHYVREIGARFEAYGKYNFSKGSSDRLNVVDQYILAEHTADRPKTKFSQYYSIGLGINAKIRKTEKSFLFIIAGLRYLNSQRSGVFGRLGNSTGHTTALLDIKNQEQSLLGYEIGFGYKRNFSKLYYAGFSVNYIQPETRISASALIGVYF